MVKLLNYLLFTVVYFQFNKNISIFIFRIPGIVLYFPLHCKKHFPSKIYQLVQKSLHKYYLFHWLNMKLMFSKRLLVYHTHILNINIGITNEMNHGGLMVAIWTATQIFSGLTPGKCSGFYSHKPNVSHRWKHYWRC